MNIQYITDGKGHKNAVLLSLSDWEKIQKDLEELDLLRDKKAFFNGLKDGSLEPKIASEMNNSAGKIINSVKVQLEYSNQRKEQPDITFLNCANT